MNDPKRWLENDGGATLEERALLEAGRQAAMPEELRQSVWLGVSAGVAGLGTGSEAAGATGAASASGAGGALGAAPAKGLLATLAASTAGKGILAIAVMASAGVGVTKLHRRSANATIADVPSARAESYAEAAQPRVEAPSASARGSAEESSGISDFERDRPHVDDRVRGEVIAQTEGTAAAPPRSSAPAARHASRAAASIAAPSEASGAAVREAPVESRAGSRLREESAAVVAIRKALVDGDPHLALRVLDRARTDFPGGVLTEEREALAVRALVAAGRSVEARQRGEAFVRAFPRSPHASEVRALVGL